MFDNFVDSRVRAGFWNFELSYPFFSFLFFFLSFTISNSVYWKMLSEAVDQQKSVKQICGKDEFGTACP